MVIPNLGDPRTATACACQAGLITIGTEMAGGGSVSREALALCRTGVRNVLVHLGVLPDTYATPISGNDRVLDLPGAGSYVYATMDGIFESFHPLGTEVRRASRPAASTAPGTRRGSRRRSTTAPTACSTDAASPAGRGRATAC